MIARSRRPSGFPATSAVCSTVSTSGALSTCWGRRCSSRGSSNSEAGLYRIRLVRAAQRKKVRSATSWAYWKPNESGRPSVLRWWYRER